MEVIRPVLIRSSLVYDLAYTQKKRKNKTFNDDIFKPEVTMCLLQKPEVGVFQQCRLMRDDLAKKQGGQEALSYHSLPKCLTLSSAYGMRISRYNP
jgi:hypothetical protein